MSLRTLMAMLWLPAAAMAMSITFRAECYTSEAGLVIGDAWGCVSGTTESIRSSFSMGAIPRMDNGVFGLNVNGGGRAQAYDPYSRAYYHYELSLVNVLSTEGATGPGTLRTCGDIFANVGQFSRGLPILFISVAGILSPGYPYTNQRSGFRGCFESSVNLEDAFDVTLSLQLSGFANWFEDASDHGEAIGSFTVEAFDANGPVPLHTAPEPGPFSLYGAGLILLVVLGVQASRRRAIAGQWKDRDHTPQPAAGRNGPEGRTADPQS